MKATLPSLLAALALASNASAVVVIDNLATGTQSFASSVTGPVGGGFLAPPAGRESAFSFVTGTTASYLDSLEMLVNVVNNTVGIQVVLSTGSSVPGGTNPVVVGTTNAAASPITQLVSVTPASTILLDASTRYWVHLTVPSGSGAYSFNNTNTPTIASGWTLENTHEYAFSTWSEITGGPQARIRLSVTPVPEASPTLLGGIGIILLLRRRARARA